MSNPLDGDDMEIVLAVIDAIRAVGTEGFDASITRGLAIGGERFVLGLAAFARSSIDIASGDADGVLDAITAGDDETRVRRERCRRQFGQRLVPRSGPWPRAWPW